MIRLRELRVWTALVVIGLSAYALRQAASVLSFGLEEALATPESAQTQLQGFVDSSVVGALARRDIALLAHGDEGGAARVDELTGLLAQRPLAGDAWLDLSAARLAAGAGPAKVAASLALSNLTGPNESYLMAARAVFGLPLWATLPPDSRRSLMADLVGGWFAVDAADRGGLKAALMVAPGKTRAEIRAALLLAGKTAAPIETALGLDDPASTGADAVPQSEAPLSDAAQSGAARSSAFDTLPQGALQPTLTAPPTALAPAWSRPGAPEGEPLRGGAGR